MPDIEVPFANQEGASLVAQNSGETLINMFSEIETSGRKKLLRRQRVGTNIEEFILQGENRGIERFQSFHYIIRGPYLYRYDGTTLITLGTLSSEVGRCTMIFDDNGNVMIADGLYGYLYDGVSLTTVSFDQPIGTLAYQGGFGIFNVPGTDQFYITGLNDFGSIDPLDFATAESEPDALVRVFIDHNELWLFGERTVEIWQLTGGADFPFARFTNAQIERGCAAPFSVAAEDNTIFWLADDGIVYRADGYRPQRVSNHTIEREIAAIPVDVRAKGDALVYNQDGNKFYTLTFPGYGTFQYNIATGFWNRAKTYGREHWYITGSAGRRTDYYLGFRGLVAFSAALNTEETDPMERGGRSAPADANGKRIAIHSYQLDCEVGRADINKEARIMMRVALDGETFRNERWRSMGATGNYIRVCMWRNLGMGKKPAIEFMVTDDVQFSVMAAYANATVSR